MRRSPSGDTGGRVRSRASTSNACSNKDATSSSYPSPDTDTLQRRPARPQHEQKSQSQSTTSRSRAFYLSLGACCCCVLVAAHGSLGMLGTVAQPDNASNRQRVLERPRRWQRRDASDESAGSSPISTKQLEPRQPDGWAETRARMLDELGARRCRLPIFYYKRDYEDYPLSSKEGSRIAQHKWRRRAGTTYREGSYRYEQKYASKDKSRKKKDRRLDIQNGLTRRITFVHVGKAGGSSVSCSIREARKYGVRKHCGGKEKDKFNDRNYKESAISRQVNCYAHYNYNGHCLENKSFLVNVRNPLHRIKSWYLYEHYLNQPVTHSQFSSGKKTQHCGNIMLGTCYQSFDHLATVGLGGAFWPRPDPSATKLRIGSNLTPEECSHWAWAAVTGGIPASYHNVFNYEWYAGPLLEMDPSRTEIFVLRVEHLDEDWTTVDKMVGGTGETKPGDVVSSSARLNVASDKPLPVTNATLSPGGMRNLCRAMCREIQVYKMLLRRAVNIDEADFRASMDELRETCSEETNETPRKCP